MQINQLPTIPQAPADADVMAIEVNGVTYKVGKQALASAILGQIGASDNVVDVSHGGTGATTAASSLTNLGAFAAANVYNGLDKTASGFALDARQGKALNDAKLSKSGGTMTNSLNFSSTIDPSVRPSADQGITRLQYLDANDNVIGGIRETLQKDDGALYNKIITRRTVNGNVKVCELGSGVSESGDYIYKVSSPEAFRNTLDVNCRINTTTVSNARVIRINVPKSSGHMFIAITSNVPSRSYVGLVTQTNNDADAPRELRIAVGNATTITFGNCMMTLDLGATATAVTVVDIIALEGSSFATVEKVS